MNKFFLVSAIGLCLIGCALGQYQTGPAYGRQQRKMAPSPQNYGAQQRQQMMPMAKGNDYGNQQQMQPKMQRTQQSYGAAQQMGAGMYGGAQQMGSYGSQQQQQAPSSMSGGYGVSNGSAKRPASNNMYRPQQPQQRQAPANMDDNYGMKNAAQNNNYGAANNNYRQQQASMGDNYGMKNGAQYEEPQHQAEPYAFGYDIDDGYGNTQYRKENGDEQGKVTGSYGYRDAYGVFRYVDYVADENGFRASVKTNEPGTANEAPADVDWQAEQPPAQTNPGSKNPYSSAGSSSSYNSANGSAGGSANGGSSGGSSYGGNSGGSSYGSGLGGSPYGSASSQQDDMSQYSSAPRMMPMRQSASQYGTASSELSMPMSEASSSYGNSNKAPISMMAGDSADMAVAQQYGSGAGSNSDSSPSIASIMNGMRNAMAKQQQQSAYSRSGTMGGRRYGDMSNMKSNMATMSTADGQYAGGMGANQQQYGTKARV